MAIKPKIKALAKELFLTPNEKGEHKHTYRDIAKIINDKFNKKSTRPLNYSTISIWAKDWQDIWDRAVSEGFVHDEQKDSNRTIIENATNAISEANAERRKKTINIIKLSDSIIERVLYDIALTTKNLTETDKTYEIFTKEILSWTAKVNSDSKIDLKNHEDKGMSVPPNYVFKKNIILENK